MAGVTQVLDPPLARAARNRARLASTGLLLALSATALGTAGTVIIGVLAWAADPRSGATAAQAARLSLAAWLLAQHVRLQVSGGSISVPPLAVTALLFFLTLRGGRLLARSSGIRNPVLAGRAVAAVCLPYGALALTFAQLARSSAVSPVLWQAACFPTALAAAGTAAGIYREAGRSVLPSWRVPGWVAPPLRAGWAAASVLLFGGMILFAAALAAHASRVAAVAAGLHAGLSGGVLLALLDAALLPNAAVAGAAYALGPGFALGTASHIGPLSSQLGALPALPVLAAIPRGGGGSALAVFGLPVVAGLLAALLLPRRWRRPPTVETVAAALATGAVAGGVLAVAAALARGSGGPGSLGSVGPSPWQVGLAATMEVGLTAALATAAGALPGLWRPRIPAQLRLHSFPARKPSPPRTRGTRPGGHGAGLTRWASGITQRLRRLLPG